MKHLCFIDIETTGTILGLHEIIDVAVIRTTPNGREILDIWQRRVGPRFPERMTTAARELNGYSESRWADAAESSCDLWCAFNDFVRAGVPVCHNPSFDRGFISLAAAKEGVQELGLDYHWIGTESLAWPLLQLGLIPKLSLGMLCEFFQLKSEPLPHIALNGAETCRQIYLRLMDMWLHCGNVLRSPA